MRPLVRCAFACGFATLFALVPSVASAEGVTLEDCLECHGKHDAERKDAQTRKTSVYVDVNGLGLSEHRGMVCVDCHSKALGKGDPHPKVRRAYCPDCHITNEPGDGVAFATIEADFAKSVHALKNDAFRCIHCHDAHTFQLKTTRHRIFEHNQVCLRCHGSEEQFQRFVQKAPPNLDKAHAWLPNRDMHWEKVRCLDCHTGYDAPIGSHLILPKKGAVKKCEACHSDKPVQLMRLYGRMRKQEVRERGFLNAAVMNDSYVIGATRNRVLDLVALGIVASTALGVGGHGALRLVMSLRRRKPEHGHEPEHGDKPEHGDNHDEERRS
jgi:hypothetical protein